MKKVWLLPTAAAFASAFVWAADSAPVSACGFKAGGAIGAVRFDQLNHTSNPINILMYANPKSDDAKNTLSPTFEKVLSKVGHAVYRTESKDDFLKIAQQGRFPCEEHGWHNVQVVIADLPDAEAVTTQNGPIVIPIVSKPAEFDQNKRLKYPNVLTPSKRPSSALPAIETVARVAHNRKGTAPILVAADVRAKAAGSGDDRTLVSTSEQRQATGAKDDRAPIAAGGSGKDAERGGAVASGQGEADKTSPPPQKKEEEPAPKEKEMVAANDAKTENVSRTIDEPGTADQKSEQAKSDQPKKETKAERLAREKAEKQAKLEEEKREKAEKAERAKQEKAEKAERAKQEKAEKAERAKQDHEAKMASRTAPASEKPQGPGLKNEVYFTPATYRLNDKASAKLAPQIKWMKDNPSAKIVLEGHADRSGRPDLNMHLSGMRADAVKKFLISKGIAESRLETQAMGDEHPVDPPGDSWRNRCVVIKGGSE